MRECLKSIGRTVKDISVAFCYCSLANMSAKKKEQWMRKEETTLQAAWIATEENRL